LVTWILIGLRSGSVTKLQELVAESLALVLLLAEGVAVDVVAAVLDVFGDGVVATGALLEAHSAAAELEPAEGAGLPLQPVRTSINTQHPVTSALPGVIMPRTLAVEGAPGVKIYRIHS
jgi:hypothetical protein